MNKNNTCKCEYIEGVGQAHTTDCVFGNETNNNLPCEKEYDDECDDINCTCHQTNTCTCASFFTVRGVHKKDCPAHTINKNSEWVDEFRVIFGDKFPEQEAFIRGLETEKVKQIIQNNGRLEERLDNLVAFRRMADKKPVLMKDLDSQMLANVKDFIRKERTQTLNRLKERVEEKRLIARKGYHDNTVYQTRNGKRKLNENPHVNIGFNLGLDAALSIINEELGEGK